MAYLKNWTDNFFQIFFMGTSWVAVSINNIKTRASSEMTSQKISKFSILMGWTCQVLACGGARYLPSLIALFALYRISYWCSWTKLIFSACYIELVKMVSSSLMTLHVIHHPCYIQSTETIRVVTPWGSWEGVKSIPRGTTYHVTVGCIEPESKNSTPFYAGREGKGSFIIDHHPGPTLQHVGWWVSIIAQIHGYPFTKPPSRSRTYFCPFRGPPFIYLLYVLRPTHSWLMRMIDEDEVGLKEKPEDTRYIKKITSK